MNKEDFIRELNQDRSSISRYFKALINFAFHSPDFNNDQEVYQFLIECVDEYVVDDKLKTMLINGMVSRSNRN